MANNSPRVSLNSTIVNPSVDLEMALKKCIQEQSVVFESAVRVIERLETAAGQRELGNPDAVVQLQKSLANVVAAQQQVAGAYERFTQSGASLNHDLRSSLSGHEKLLKTLIHRIDQLQQTFAGLRSDLTPQLDVESRRRNMHAAYRQSMNTM